MSTLYEILNKYPNEIKSSAKQKQVIIIKAKDRAADQTAIESELTKNKFVFYRQQISALSGSSEVTIIDYGKICTGCFVYLVFKPLSGGMSETTLNSTITELAPALAFANSFHPKNVEDFYTFLKQVDHSKNSVYAVERDMIAGKKFIDDFPSSSKFTLKMTNALHVLDFLYQKNKEAPIDKVIWGYRAKPWGISMAHKGDLFIKYKTGGILGVSLKAGEANTKEPKLNTYVNVVLSSLDISNNTSEVTKLRCALWEKTYSTLFGKGETSATITKTNYDTGANKKTIIAKVSAIEKNNLTKYDDLYDRNLTIIRNSLVKSMNVNYENTMKYLCSAIVGVDAIVPLLVVKATSDRYEILTDEDDISVFLKKTTSINSYISNTSKQDFYIELVSSKTDKLKLKFSVRTNKVGNEHKLGQFYNLAVKFAGVM